MKFLNDRYVEEEIVKFDLKFTNKVNTASWKTKLKTLNTPLKSQKKKKLGNNSPASKFASKLSLEVMPNVKRLAARLETEDPNYLYSQNYSRNLVKCTAVLECTNQLHNSGPGHPTNGIQERGSRGKPANQTQIFSESF